MEEPISKMPEISASERFLPRLALERRIAVLVLLLSILVVGTIATLGIPLEMLPRGFEPGMMTIQAGWQQAPPQEVLEKVTQPLEEELSTVPGLENVYSFSTSGRANLRLAFKSGVDMDVAYREVRDRLERAKARMPDDLDRVVIRKADDSHIPVYAFGITVDPAIEDAWHLIQNEIITPIQRIDGVAGIAVNGLVRKEVLIELDRERTEAAGLDVFQLGQQLQNDNFTLASGHVETGGKKLLLRSVAKYADLESLRNRRLGPQVRLRDVAEVRYAEPEIDFSARANSRPAYFAIVRKESEANAIEVSKSITQAIEKIRANPRMRPVGLTVFFDQGKTILESLTTLVQSGLLGALLAAMILFFFLRRVRLTLIITLSIPLSIVIALTAMFFFGETLNILTLLGLMISVGMVVDNSVVVAENIFRLHRAGLPRREAAIRGAGEISLAILLSTLTSIVVFLPVSLVGGMGQFFLLRLSIPITVALLGSLFVALVLVPLATYLTLPEKPQQRQASAPLSTLLGRLYEASFGRLATFYGFLLERALRHRFDTLVLISVAVALTGAFSVRAVKIAAVQEEQKGGFEIQAEMPISMTFEESAAYCREIEKVFEDNQENWDLSTYLLLNGRDNVRINGWFNTPRRNKVSARAAVEELLAKVPERAGVHFFTGDNDAAKDDTRELATFTLTGEDPRQLEELAKGVEERLAKVPGVLGVRLAALRQTQEMAVRIDRDRAQRLEVNPQAVAGVVRNSVGGRPLPKFYRDGLEIPVRVRYEEADRSSLLQLFDFRVPTDQGEMVALSSVATPDRLQAADEIQRTNKQVSRTITFELEDGREKETRELLQRQVAATDLPEGVRFGQPRRGAGMDEDTKALIFALGLSIAFIYLLMGFLFESFVLPLSILTTIPLAILGVYWAHHLAGMDIDALGLVGLVLLVGVVVNNGIVLIDYVGRLRGEGFGRSEALLLATERRFRPILMTALTTILGMVPMLFTGRTSIGISYTSFATGLIGGMTVATFLTLLVVPIAYTYFDDLREKSLAFAGRLMRTSATKEELSTNE